MLFLNKKYKKTQNESEEIKKIQLKLETLMRDNRELHRCLYKLHSQLLSQIHELKELSAQNNTLNSTFLPSPVPSPRYVTDKRALREAHRKLQNN